MPTYYIQPSQIERMSRRSRNEEKKEEEEEGNDIIIMLLLVEASIDGHSEKFTSMA